MLRSKLETPTDRNNLPEVETFPLETAAFRLATSLVHSSPIAAAAWWSSTNAETCNGAFRALTHNPEVWQAFHSFASASYRDGLPRIEENVLIPVGEQERYFTIAIYPLIENDSCGGVFGTFQDVTPAVLNAKRFDILRELKDQLQKAVSADEACQAGMAVFSRHSKDVPFALLYLFGQNDAQGQLVAAVGVEKQSAAIPERFWAMAAGVQIVEAPSWAESSQCAVVIPMSGRDTANQLGYLVAGMPKGQTRDERQKVFFSLIANSIAGALSSFRKKTTSEEVSEVLESITDGVVALDQNWIIRYVNREAERLSGMGREDLVGRTQWDVFPQTFGTELHRNCLRALADKVTTEFEFFYPSWQRWFYIKAHPAPDGGLSIFYEDITKRKASGQALRESEERFRAAIQVATSLLWTNNARGEMVGEQPGWGGFTGQTREEYQGYGWSKAVHVEDAQPTIDAWEEAVAERRTFTFEHRVRRNDGEWRLCSIRAVPILDEQGEIREWVGVHSDITDERNLLRTVQESEERFRELANAMPQIVWTARPDGVLDYYNERWYEFTGFDRENLADSSWDTILHLDDVQLCCQAWQRSLNSGEPYRIEYRFWDRKSGQYRWFLARALPVVDGNGGIVRWFGTCTDIDEQKRNQEELVRANQDLEQFALSATQELKEPLSNIATYSQLLMKNYGQKWDGQATEYLSYMVEGARRMNYLISDLLAYTEAGNLQEELVTEVSTEKVFRDIARLLRREIEDSEAEITSTPLPMVRMEPAHVQQIFHHLIANSLKYRRQDELPLVSISAARQNRFWQFSIRDNGVGIAAESQAKVFSVFKRLLTSSGKYAGTGIGLAICQKIVMRYGGRIWLESPSGGGLTVSLRSLRRGRTFRRGKLQSPSG